MGGPSKGARPPERRLHVHVAAHGNAFMADIASWLAEAAGRCGWDAALSDDGCLPTPDGALHLVVAPHEFYELSDSTDAERHLAAQCSVPVCTEQPGTKWFDMTALLVEASSVVLDINQHGVDALRQRGIPAQHLRLGGVASMNRASQVDRDIDVLFMGGLTPHRASELAALGPHLWNRQTDLRLFDFSRPVRGDVAGLVFGNDKYDLLARSNIVVNIHRDHTSAGYFEWARMVEAMANGCTVVTEPSSGCAPLVAGEHFVETDDIAATVVELLNDPAHCREIGQRAATAILDEFPLTATLGPTLEEIAVRSRPDDSPTLSGNRPARSAQPPKYRARLQRAQQMPLLPAFRPDTALRRRVGEALHAEVEIRRGLDALACEVRHSDPHHLERVTTSGYESATPDVTVIVTLFNYESVVGETLDSIVASTDIGYEIVVVDDHSTDAGRDAVVDFMHHHPDVPMLLLGADSNRGLPAARNLAFEHARADKVMVMDADNHVYPTCLRRLSDALDADTGASFAWAILEEFGIETGLRSAVGWHLPWLCAANNIDAQAMIRTSVWRSLGGYRTDDALVFGWEDWELWLRIAADGGRGVHVRQILGRYRRQENSMLATSNLFSDIMTEHLHELHPTLPWPT